MKTRKVSGSEAVILSLLEEGVDTIFGYPGGAIMPIYDLLYDYQDKINHILTRHEQGAAHAAQGYARVTGRVGVCMVTSGPGATNLTTGLADAMLDSTPIICISGQVISGLLGTDAFQETDVMGFSMPITKWNIQITKAEDIPEMMARAFFIATTGRPGPVMIDITKDAQFAEFDFSYEKCRDVRSYVPRPKLNMDYVEKAAELINNAKKPLALVGQGVILSGAEKEMLAFIEKAEIPAAWTLLGNSAMPTDHPLNVGMLGMHGNYGPNIKTNESDLLIALGMRFDDRVTGNVKTYGTQAKVVHFEIDHSEVNKIVKADVAVIADIKETFEAILPLIKKNKHEEWLNQFKNAYQYEYEKVIQQDIYPEKEGLTMGEVIRIINEKMKGEAILVTDVGQHQMIANRYFKFNNSRSLVTSGGLGTMGFGLPAAFGAQTGQPDKTVVAVIGDGGFQMTVQELGTIWQNKAPVKIVLLNNNFLGMVRQWQQMFFDKRYSSTELTNPDFITIAKGFGITGTTVSRRDDLEGAIAEMFKHEGPYLLEVKVEKEDNVFPMVTAGASVSDIRLE
ncbi:MAG: biosynthetic-type acetolactate synthase large subunit [Bacteroidales bacterium]|nr:biosynthetic-type acetolactate synthase large subunit [Bacteroidales bacterium]